MFYGVVDNFILGLAIIFVAFRQGLSDDSTIKRAGSFISVLLVCLGDSMMGGEMDPVATS